MTIRTTFKSEINIFDNGFFDHRIVTYLHLNGQPFSNMHPQDPVSEMYKNVVWFCFRVMQSRFGRYDWYESYGYNSHNWKCNLNIYYKMVKGEL